MTVPKMTMPATLPERQKAATSPTCTDCPANTLCHDGSLPGRIEIKSIQREEFLAFLKKHGEGSLHAAKALFTDYKAAFVDARRLALSGSPAGRLAGVLLDWGKTAACGKFEMRFTMALAHEELANMVGSSRETVTRMLTRFKKDHLIQMRGSSILILAPDLLESLAV